MGVKGEFVTKPPQLVSSPLSANSEVPLSEAVYETLLEAILAGTLKPGDPVSEIALSRQLEVSRSPVHDAVVQLAGDGLIVLRPNRRPIVAAFSREDVFHIFEVRTILEGAAAERAASRIDRSSLDELRSELESLAADFERPDWVHRWTDHDERFHEAIAGACGNPRLAADVARYRLLHRGFNKFQTNVDCLHRAVEEHLQILEALVARDPNRSREAMISHVREWQAYFVNHMPG